MHSDVDSVISVDGEEDLAPIPLHLLLALNAVLVYGQPGKGVVVRLSDEEVIQQRERLFDIIREIVQWENINNEEVLEKARAEIRKSWERTCEETGEDPGKLPAFHDPFAGGGALPLEALRPIGDSNCGRSVGLLRVRRPAKCSGCILGQNLQNLPSSRKACCRGGRKD